MNSELILLEAARRMDQDALAQIFDLYAPALFHYAVRLAGDPVLADHIVGDVFARLLDQLAEGRGPRSNLRSYLYETAYHRIVDESRYSKRRAGLETAVMLRQDHSAIALGVEDQIQFKQLLQAMQELSDDQRHVIVLRFLEDFSLRETAAVMGKRIEHIKVLQNRGLARLRRALERKALMKAMRAPTRMVPEAFGL